MESSRIVLSLNVFNYCLIECIGAIEVNCSDVVKGGARGHWPLLSYCVCMVSEFGTTVLTVLGITIVALTAALGTTLSRQFFSARAIGQFGRDNAGGHG